MASLSVITEDLIACSTVILFLSSFPLTMLREGVVRNISPDLPKGFLPEIFD